MKVGYADADITPKVGITLSGFASRCDQESQGIADALHLRALVLEDEGDPALVISFELLALGPELTELLHVVLDDCVDLPIPRERRLFCCIHTHSAPATITLHGCGIPNMAYWNLICESARQAAVTAFRGRVPAELRTASVNLPNASYNRRQRLDDGRTVMVHHAAESDFDSGVVLEEMKLFQWVDETGRAIAGMAHWAAHPVTVGELRVTADYPGELCRRLVKRFQCPFMFLQGAAGDINVPFHQMSYGEMLHNVDLMEPAFDGVRWSDSVSVEPFRFATSTVQIAYGALPSRESISAFMKGMWQIAETGSGASAQEEALNNILNVEPGEEAPLRLKRHTAWALCQWGKSTLSRMESGVIPTQGVALSVIRLGSLLFCGIAVEPFAQTAIDLQEALPEYQVLILGYAAPLAGYLPTRQAMEDGGFEVQYSYRFFGHPATFAPDSERKVREALMSMIRQMN